MFSLFLLYPYHRHAQTTKHKQIFRIKSQHMVAVIKESQILRVNLFIQHFSIQ